MKYNVTFFLSVSCLLALGFNQQGRCQQQPSIPVKGYELIWQDEFDGRKLDRTKWNFRGTGQKRGEAFIDERSVAVDGNGFLMLEAKKAGDSIITGMIATENIFETTYGYFECRSSLTTVSGIFPAFWLQSRLNQHNGTPETNGAELDIFEYFQHAKKDSVAHTLHWGGYGATHKVAGPVWGALKKTKDGFHTFGLEWTPDSYSTFVDGVQTSSGSRLISKVPEFIVLSLGVNKEAAGPVKLNELPERFIVDYVRVYKKKRK